MREYKFNFTIQLERGISVSNNYYLYKCLVNGVSTIGYGKNEKEVIKYLMFELMNETIKLHFDNNNKLTAKELFDKICESEEQL